MSTEALPRGGRRYGKADLPAGAEFAGGDGTGEDRSRIDDRSLEQELVWSAERAMYRQRGLVDQLRERIDATSSRCAGNRASVGTIDELADSMEIRGLLKVAGDVCREELVVLNPEGQEAEWEALLEVCGALLDRGVAVRVVLPHRSRATFGTRARARKLVDSGASLRTIGQVPRAAAIFDRSVAVIFDAPVAGGPPRARRVREEVVVRFLLTMFDQLWEGGAPFGSGDEGYADEVTDDLQRSVARLMAEGFTDEVVARRLGMSVRTCRRHIAGLLARLGAVSRFQAGVIAAQYLAGQRITAG